MYRLLSTPALSKALEKRMKENNLTPAKPYAGTTEEKDLAAHAATVIRDHLDERQKIRT